MRRPCRDCGRTYDDALAETTCPHDRFISDSAAARKDAACALVGKTVRFAHQPDGPDRRVTSISFDGMVTLDSPEVAGLFAPHLFVVVGDA